MTSARSHIMAHLNLGVAAGLYPWRVAATTLTAPAAAYRALTEDVALVDRSERGKLALTGAEAKALPPRPGHQRRRGARARQRLLRGVPHAQGQDARRPARSSTPGDELLLDTERVALQALFNMIRRGTRRLATSSCTSARSSAALLSLVGPGARRAAARRRGLRARARAAARATLGGAAVRAASRPTSASTSCATPTDAEPRRAPRSTRRRGAGRRPRPRSLRVERGRPRYGVDLDDTVIPQEAGPQRARGVASRRAATSARRRSRACTTAASRTATCAGCACRRPPPPGDAAARSASARSGTLGQRRRLPARCGPIALALVRREAEPGDTIAVGAAPAAATVVELPFTPR